MKRVGGLSVLLSRLCDVCKRPIGEHSGPEARACLNVLVGEQDANDGESSHESAETP